MKKTIPLIVVVCHLLFLLFLTKAIHIKEKKKKEEKVVVNFIEEFKAKEDVREEKVLVEAPPIAVESLPLPPPPLIEEEPPEEKPAPPPEPKKAPPPPPKKKAEKPKTVSKPKPKPVTKTKPKAKAKKPATKKAPKKEAVNNQKLASLMQESLELLEKGTGPKKEGKKSSAKKIGDLGVEGLKNETIKVQSYESEMVLYLKKKLKLLEPGVVKIKLTLSSNGKVESLQIVSGESEKNKEVVAAKVPTISFPPFDSRMEGEKSHTFHITLKSDF